MPVYHLDYTPPFYLRNGHVHTIYASYARAAQKLPNVLEERLDTPDDDFLDVDWYRNGNRRLLLISHGLEGHTSRPYVVGMTAAAIAQGWDVLAWNYRGCNGIPNNKLQSYHSGCTHDLDFLVHLAVERGYREISLCGFSIGGNKTLLYLGREVHRVPKEVKSAITFSVPCDLVSSSAHLARPSNRIYMKNFLGTLEVKLKQKQRQFPQAISLDGYKQIKTFKEFDDRYTAPINGFDSALDYWTKSSCLHHLDKINIPAALITSLDDPFLTDECYPREIAERQDNFHLMLTRWGGHVGFVGKRAGPYYSEEIGLKFLSDAR